MQHALKVEQTPEIRPAVDRPEQHVERQPVTHETDAEAEGLIRDASGDKPVTLLPPVLDGVEKFYASTFLTFAAAIRGATRDAAAMVT